MHTCARGALRCVAIMMPRVADMRDLERHAARRQRTIHAARGARCKDDGASAAQAQRALRDVR